MEDLQGKVAVITGGASGIGRAVADRAAAEGMKVVLADIEEGPLKAAVDDLTSHGAEAMGVVTDVADAASVRALRDLRPRPLRRRAPRAQQRRHRSGRSHLGGQRGGLALDPRGEPLGRHPRRRHLHAAC